MTEQQIPTSEVLNRAADLIEERGWVKGSAGFYGEGGFCILGAAMAAGEYRENQRMDFYGSHLCGSLTAYLGLETGEGVWQWNDAPERTSTEVIEALRATALIEAARESQDAAELTYAENVRVSA